jgi:hypothetical protein
MVTHDRSTQSPYSGFISIETIAIIIIIVLVVIVAGAILFTPKLTTPTPPADTLPQKAADLPETQQDIRFIDPNSPFAPTPVGQTGKPFNEKAFEDNKIAFASTPNKIQGTRFKGRILSIDRTNGLTMQMSSLLENGLGIEVTYHFNPETLPKVSVKGGSLESLAVNQEINIDETNDYTKTYQESIQSVEISTIE